MVREKKVIEHLYDYGVVCSYDEVKRFQTSVEVAANEMTKGNMLRPRKYGLVQVVADNFDATISSQNGLKQIHSLVMIKTELLHCTHHRLTSMLE